MNKLKREALIGQQRVHFHAGVLEGVMRKVCGIPSNADRGSPTSVAIAQGVFAKIAASVQEVGLGGTPPGRKFKDVCMAFITSTVLDAQHPSSRNWTISRRNPRLKALEDAARGNEVLGTLLRDDSTLCPDIVIEAATRSASALERRMAGGDSYAASSSWLPKTTRRRRRVLLASIACKWPVRGRGKRPTRSEGLNLAVRATDRLAHALVVTGEPMPTRIATNAFGTNDVDCVYHFALKETVETLRELRLTDQFEMLQEMVVGGRLKDISDLPLDLAL